MLQLRMVSNNIGLEIFKTGDFEKETFPGNLNPEVIVSPKTEKLKPISKEDLSSLKEELQIFRRVDYDDRGAATAREILGFIQYYERIKNSKNKIIKINEGKENEITVNRTKELKKIVQKIQEKIDGDKSLQEFLISGEISTIKMPSIYKTDKNKYKYINAHDYDFEAFSDKEFNEIKDHLKLFKDKPDTLGGGIARKVLQAINHYKNLKEEYLPQEKIDDPEKEKIIKDITREVRNGIITNKYLKHILY